MKTKHLVVDTAAFVKNVPLWEYGEEFYSVPEILGELRDKATRLRYEALPVTITMREPQPWAIRFVNQFSKKTGDYASLSLADVKILALTYELEIEAWGSSDHLRSEPQKCVIEGPTSKPESDDQQNIEGFHLPADESDGLNKISDIPSSETYPPEIGTHSSADSPSDPCDITDTDINHYQDQLLGFSSLRSSLINDNTPVHSKTVNVFWCHMIGLEDYLGEHSYIGGYNPTSDDSSVYEALTKEYPQFRPTLKNRYTTALSAMSLLPADTMRPLHSTFPCIKRWSYHISSFSEKEKSLFPATGRDLGEVLLVFEGNVRNRKETSKLPDLIGQKTTILDSALQVDMSALTVSDVDESNEKGCKGDTNKSKLNHDDDVGVEVNNSTEGSASYSEESDVEENGLLEEDGCFEYENCDELGDVDTYQEDCTRNEDDDEDNGEDDDDDDDEGWITPSNIKHHKLKNKAVPKEEDEDEREVLVACVSSDFAIQNMLKHIGLSVMGVDGKIIRQIRTFILRCYACFKTCSDVSKIFCPKCGNKTLKRVSVTVNPDGTQKIWINFKKPINTKGMRFTLPRPRGGQHARNPILVADQKEVRQMASKMSKKKINPLHEDYDPDNAPFAVRDIYSRAAQLGYSGDKCHNHFYWERKNPNARLGRSKKKK